MSPVHVALEIFRVISHLQGAVAYGTIIGILLVCGLGVPIPEDITLLCAGLLASAENITIPGAILAGLIGVITGDAFLFFMGRRFGKKVFKLPGLRRIFTADRVVAAERRIRQNGPFICFIARFLPGLRSPVFAMAGALGVKRHTFFLLDGVAALISVPVWVYLGFWFGSNLDEAVKKAEHIQGFILIGLAVLIAVYFGFKSWRRGARNRRRSDSSISPAITELNDRKGMVDRNT